MPERRKEHKTMNLNHLRAQRGGSLLYVLLIMMTACLVASSILSLTSTSTHLTQRNNNRIRNLYVAIAGSEKAKEDLNYFYRDHSTANEEDLQMISPPYFAGHYFYEDDWSPGLRITREGEPTVGEVESGNFVGMHAVKQNYLIQSTCRDNQDSKATVTENISINAIPLAQFAVFYERDLEILPGPNFIIEGWVHSNRDLYAGSENSLSFDSRITAVGDIYHRRKNDGTVMPGEVRIRDADGNYQSIRLPDGVSLDSNHPDWAAQSVLRWDNRVRNRVHGVPKLRLPIDVSEEPHDIIERPNAADST